MCLIGAAGSSFSTTAVRAQEQTQSAATTGELQTESVADSAKLDTRTADPEEIELVGTPLPGAVERDVSWRTLPRNFAQDQKDIWLFPLGLAKGRHWIPTLAVTGVTAGLIAGDPQDAPYFRRTAQFETFNKTFSGSITAAEIGLVPAAFLVIGHFRHDSYAEKTALLAGEAYADSAIVEIVMKAATRRLRPSDIAPAGPFSDTFFRSHVSPTGINTSFPSGHSAAAFAVATVFAHRYRQHRWVPWVAYGAAGVIAFSRITNQSHFPSDVFLGAAIGFSISQFAVLRPR